MRFLGFLFGRRRSERESRLPPPRFGADELARRLGVPIEHLRAVPISYREFRIPKKRGGSRRILAPAPPLKQVQRTIHRRLLRRLIGHPAAMGFERDHSIATHALLHVHRAVVVRMDIRRFFESTTAQRIEMFFRYLGWDEESAGLLTKLTTHEGALPQGAPSSPRLSNLVNFMLDKRLDLLATKCGAVYSRYADDLTFSFETDDGGKVKSVMGAVRKVLADYGYHIHHRKTRIRRRHQQQRVAGLVVNDRVNLPRETRRRLRAIEHHLRTGRNATLNETQLIGWRALRHMIAVQTRNV